MVAGANGLSLAFAVDYMKLPAEAGIFHPDSRLRGFLMTMLEYERMDRGDRPKIRLSQATTRILKSISEMQPCTAKDIAQDVDLSPNTVRDHLASLYYGGWIERATSPFILGYFYMAINDD